MTKKEIVFKNATAIVFDLELSEGHLRWKVTELAKRSGVSRALIYKYLGSSKEEIIINSIEIVSSLIQGYSSPSRDEHWEKGKQELSIIESYEISRNYQSAMAFYFYWSSKKNSPYRGIFLKNEKRIRKRLERLYPNKDSSDPKILTIRFLLAGYLNQPFTNKKEIKESLEYFKSKILT